MRVLARKVLSFMSALRSPRTLPRLMERNILQLRGWIRGGRPWPYRIFRDVPFVCIPSDDSSLRLCQFGYAETTELTVIHEWVQPGDTCIDVGANIGVYTAVFAHRV